MSDTITITVRRIDAAALVMGPLDYVVKVMSGEIASGGSPMAVREALAMALQEQS